MLNEKKNKEAVEEMKCPYCNQEMEAGFLTSDARCIAWRRERHEPWFPVMIGTAAYS